MKTLIPVAWSCGADIVVFFCTVLEENKTLVGSEVSSFIPEPPSTTQRRSHSSSRVLSQTGHSGAVTRIHSASVHHRMEDCGSTPVWSPEVATRHTITFLS